MPCLQCKTPRRPRRELPSWGCPLQNEYCGQSRNIACRHSNQWAYTLTRDRRPPGYFHGFPLKNSQLVWVAIENAKAIEVRIRDRARFALMRRSVDDVFSDEWFCFSTSFCSFAVAALFSRICQQETKTLAMRITAAKH